MINQDHLREGFIEIDEVISQIIDTQKEPHDYLSNYILFAGEIDYAQLGTKAAYNSLYGYLKENGGASALQAIYNQACLSFTEDQMELVIGIVVRTIKGTRSSAVYKIDNTKPVSRDLDSIDGDIEDLSQLFHREPWYLMTLLALI